MMQWIMMLMLETLLVCIGPSGHGVCQNASFIGVYCRHYVMRSKFVEKSQT
jgi:hypothetical protein